jgi:hypothetical protein
MRQAAWILALAIGAGLAYWVWHGVRRYREKKEAEAARTAEFLARAAALAAAKPAGNPAPAAANAAPAAGVAQTLAQDELLFDAATKAGEAGEPALAIQLYARLIARYPASALAGQARARIEVQKRLVKA